MAMETPDLGGAQGVQAPVSRQSVVGAGRAAAGGGLRIERLFTTPGIHPFDQVAWDTRTATIGNEKGETVFEQKDVEVPAFWSQLATNVVVSKYFRGTLGTPDRERSVKQLISRVVDTITVWGKHQGYFATDDDAKAFHAELTFLLLHQRASFNSPVWFNVGIEKHPQCSACQPYHALVNTAHGLMPIGEIVERNLVGLPVYDHGGLTQVIATKPNGRKPVYRIQLSDGFSIEATGDHLVCAHATRRTRRIEWRRVDQLTPGMVMRVYAHTPKTVTAPAESKAVAEAALAGWLQADGFVGQYEHGTNQSLTIELMTVDDQEFDWVMQHLQQAFPNQHYHVSDVATQDPTLRGRRIRLYGETLRPFVEQYGLLRRGQDLRVPQPMWTAPNDAVTAYMKSLFQSDGYAAVHVPSAHVAFAVTSKEWVAELQRLLTRCGIYARLRQKNERRPDRHDMWELDISIRSEREAFRRSIGFISERKNAKLRESLRVPGKRCPAVRYSRVVSIEPIGEMDVYDIQTTSGCYLTNSVLVHNCFILSVDDTMESILEWYKTEGMIFKYGSGSGLNLSTIRGSRERLIGGGTASGPVSFMRAADASAGVIKSGGKTRRAAKMVVLNADHPDVKAFILCKWKEEEKAWKLVDAGYDAAIDGEAYGSVFFQNANNSVRVTDEFMRRALKDEEWELRAVTTGEVLERTRAKELLRLIAEATWHCGDPGMQFDTTVNDWHTCPNSGRINASNPCFAGDALVYTDKGLVSFRALHERVQLGEAFRVFTHDATHPERPATTVSITRPTQVMQTGVNEVYRLRFSNGVEVKATANHRFFTSNRGMVAAKDLQPADEVMLLDQPVELASALLAIDLDDASIFASGWGGRDTKDYKPIQLPRVWTSRLAEYVGYLVGDGSVVEASDAEHRLSTASVVFGDESEADELGSHFEALLDEIGVSEPQVVGMPNGTVQMRVNRTPVVRFLKQLGVRECKAHEKRVPHTIFQAPGHIVAGFLRGLFTADGCVYSGKTTRYIGLGSTSEQLLREVQQLLLMCGIASRIYATAKPKRVFSYARKDGSVAQYQSKQTYDLRISGSAIVRFKDRIGFLTSTKQSKLDLLLQTYRLRSVQTTVRLVERMSVGYEPTYNLTEPKNHSYIVNGLLVANCSEYMHLDNSACNLASLNLMKFLDETGRFLAEEFKHAVGIMILAQDIVVDNSSYPTPKITANAKAFRELGLGYANLGALLMSQGIAYDSDAGRAWAGAITALMCGHAYRMSSEIAERLGPFVGYAVNREPMLRVIRKHRDALGRVDAHLVPDELFAAASEAWDEALLRGEQHGYRNSQVTVIAPTGTIAFMMDCDTTGVEPDIALVKYKKLVGGGMLKIVNQTVPKALEQLGYAPEAIKAIVNHLDERETIEGAPGLMPEHLPVFDCAFRPLNGTRSIHHMGHVRMMAAVQPFVSGAISKCVTGDTLIPTRQGLVPIASFFDEERPGSFKPLERDVVSLDGVRQTDQFYFGGIQDVIRVQLRDGRRITATPSHQLYVASSRGLSWKRMDELQEGDFIAIKLGDRLWAEEDADLKGFVPSEPHGSQKVIRVPQRMSPDLAWLLGVYTAEGNITASNWTTAIHSNCRAVQEKVRRIVQELFGLDVDIRQERTVVSCKVSSKTLVEFLRFCGVGEGAEQKIVPWSVLQSTEACVRAFVSGVYLDGYIPKSVSKVGFCVASQVLVDQLQVVLSNFGILSAQIRKHNAELRKDYVELNVFGRHAQAFVREFPLDEPEKQERAVLLLQRTFAQSWADVVPCFDSRMAFVGAPWNVKARYENQAYGNPNTISWETLKRLVGDPEVPTTEEMAFVVRNNLHFVPVRQVMSGLRELVYDFSVPDVHAFVGNGIVNHNTVNLPHEATVEEIMQAYVEAWKLGLKAIAIYRDGSKRTQPLSTGGKASKGTAFKPARRRLPDERRSITHKFSIAGHEGYITVGMYEDGQPGEIFIIMSKEGSVVSGLVDSFATAISLALQYGVPLSVLVQKFAHVRFEPSGVTNNPEIRFAKSIVDYIFRWLALKFLPAGEQVSNGAKSEAAAAATIETPTATTQTEPSGSASLESYEKRTFQQQADAPPCPDCGSIMVRNASCYKCLECGTTSGCS